MDSRGRGVVILFRGHPRRDERQKRLPRRFLSTLHVAILKTMGGFRLGECRWQLDTLEPGEERAGYACRGPEGCC